MTKERSRNVFPFLGLPQLHFQDGSDTWKTINKTVACCFLLRPTGGQVKEIRASALAGVL